MVCLMRPTARTSWPKRDILVTLVAERNPHLIDEIQVNKVDIAVDIRGAGNGKGNLLTNERKVGAVKNNCFICSYCHFVFVEDLQVMLSGSNVFLTTELKVKMTKRILLPPRLTLSLVQWLYITLGRGATLIEWDRNLDLNCLLEHK